MLFSLRSLLEQIEKKLATLGRPANAVRLLAVSKGQSPDAICELARFGQLDFGENYVQEWKKKAEALAALVPNLRWHFTGRIQTNKIKFLLKKIVLFHAIDRFELAQKLDEMAAKEGLICRGLVEVNLIKDPAKAGIAPEFAEEELKKMNRFSNLEITGLMAMAPFSTDIRQEPGVAESSRPYFKGLRELKDELNRKSVYRRPLIELSMGMSDDFWTAIEEGATWIRLGRALFGERS